jgi:hypothetical protein
MDVLRPFTAPRTQPLKISGVLGIVEGRDSRRKGVVLQQKITGIQVRLGVIYTGYRMARDYTKLAISIPSPCLYTCWLSPGDPNRIRIAQHFQKVCAYF